MNKYNPAISFIRVTSMFSIILGHVCTEYGINTYQFGGIGVERFLFLSGYLYGTKYISDYRKWGGTLEKTYSSAMVRSSNMSGSNYCIKCAC